MGNKRVLITGNQGFIGTWLAYKYYKVGYEVYGVDNRSSYGERLFDKTPLNHIVEKQYDEDVANFDAINEIVREVKPVLIINMAGQAIVPRAFREPIYTFMTNSVGTLSVLEAGKRCIDTKSVICITSDKVYENLNQVWGYRENDKLGGKDIYSVSKSSAELIASSYAKTHLNDSNVNVQTVRLGNVVGGGDWSVDRLIPDLINAIMNNKSFYIRYPDATRPFQHVLDVVDGIFEIGTASINNEVASGDCWNLGPRDNSFEIVSNVINVCRSIWPEVDVLQNENNIKEDLTLSVDVSKLTYYFNSPKYNSRQAIKKAFSWYEMYHCKQVPLIELIEREFETYEDVNEII